ncbi:unnamed protein product [Caenorhabditis angaria]|uniref:Uncharacterized protein n=1 Tax=Caenorhabditis angaria TaxID=860376 RepID=A0A9P1II17_9PELO|nr:unnamed protein product [Caenorhabditis angaria]
MHKIGAIGILIILGFILDTIAVFTTGWIEVSVVAIKNYYYGISPFQSGSKPTWFNVASWLMFISFILALVQILAFLHALSRIRNCGCSHSIRHSFNLITSISAIISIFIFVAFILTAANLKSFLGYADASLGYSSFIALAAAILIIIAGGLSQHVRHFDCC